MNIDIPYYFINLLAFNALFKYENRRAISVDTLNKYRETLLDEVKRIYQDEAIYGDDTYFLPQDEWKGTVTFIEKDENMQMSQFLETFSDLFELRENNVCLKDDVDYGMLESEIEKLRVENNLGVRFDTPSSNARLREVLGIKGIEEQLKGYLRIEEKIENLYGSLDTIGNDRIKPALLVRGIFLNNISCLPDETIGAFKDVSGEFVCGDTECDYVQKPFDVDLWNKCTFYDKDDYLGDMDTFIYDLYIYSIFGDKSLKYKKLHDDLLKVFYAFDGVVKVASSEDELFDDTIDYDEDTCYDGDTYYDGDAYYDDLDDGDYGDIYDEYGEEFDEELDDELESEFSNIYLVVCEEKFVFYLNYVNKLDRYMEDNGYNDSLVTARNRLLYAIDEPRLCLYQKENLEREVKNSKTVKFDEGAFSFMRDEARFMTEEVFSDKDEINSIKKLLFISTYYQFTGDEAIKEIMFRHCSSDRVGSYSDLVFGEENGYSKKKTINNN